MIIEVLFFFFFAAFVVYDIIEYRKYQFEDSLLRLMGNISIAMRKGATLRTAIEKFYMKMDPASELLRKIIAQGEKEKIPLRDALKKYEDYQDSLVMKTFVRLVEYHFDSKVDIAGELQGVGLTIQTVKKTASTFHQENYLAIRIIQMLTVIGVPTMILFLSEILELEPYIWTYYFMAFVVLAYSAMDFAIFNNWKKAVVMAPFFFMAYLMAITTLYGYVSWFFMGFY